MEDFHLFEVLYKNIRLICSTAHKEIDCAVVQCYKPVTNVSKILMSAKNVSKVFQNGTFYEDNGKMLRDKYCFQDISNCLMLKPNIKGYFSK